MWEEPIREAREKSPQEEPTRRAHEKSQLENSEEPLPKSPKKRRASLEA